MSSQTTFVKALEAYNAYVLKNGGAKLHRVVVNRLPARLEGLHRYIASEARSLYAKAVLLAAEAGVLLGYNDAAEIEVPASSAPTPEPVKKEQKPKPSVTSSGPTTFAKAMSNRMKERLLPLHENEVHGSYTVEGEHPHSFHISCTRVDLYPTEESLVKDLARLGIKTENLQGGTQWASDTTRYYHFILPAGVDKITKRLHTVLDGKKPVLPTLTATDPAVAASKVIEALEQLQKAAEKVMVTK